MRPYARRMEKWPSFLSAKAKSGVGNSHKVVL